MLAISSSVISRRAWVLPARNAWHGIGGFEGRASIRTWL